MAYSFFLVSEDKKVQFPIAPSELTISVNGRNETIELMNEGEVNLLKSPGLTEISFTALIPQVTKFPFSVNNEPIDTFVNFLNEMLTKKKPFRFVVVRTAGTKLLFDTNLRVACESYNMKESADNGFDIELDISLKQYRDYGIKTITLVSVSTTNSTPNKITNNSEETGPNKLTSGTSESSSTKPNVNLNKKTRDTKKNTGKKHTVKKGDTLWAIAKKYYGKGSSWKKIYNKNKSVIEKAAKKHGKKSSSNGHWIYPSTVLIIP